MGYAKKEFNGNYLTWYTTISSHGDSSVKDLYSYSGVSQEVEGLNWKGKNRNSICKNVSSIDNTCQSYYNAISILLGKTKIVNGPFIGDLTLLKDKIEAYNRCVDEYNSINSQLQKALMEEGNKNG